MYKNNSFKPGILEKIFKAVTVKILPLHVTTQVYKLLLLLQPKHQPKDH